MNRIKISIFTFLLLLVGPATARIDFNKNCNQSFDDIFKLKLPKAAIRLNAEIEKNPQNAYAYYLLGLEEIIDVFSSENEKSYKALKKSIPIKLKQIEKLGGKTAYTQFFKGQLLFYYGITQTKFNDFFSAGSTIRDSYITLKNNAVKYPKFLPNNTIMGVIETFSGSAPASFKWIINMFGVKASVRSGMNRIGKMANIQTDDDSELKYFKLEAQIFQGGMYHLILHNEKKGWDIISNCTNDWKTNLFSTYLRSSFLIKTGDNEQAIGILSNRPSGADYTNLKFLDYLLGVAKLSRLDKDADLYLISYIKHFKGRHYLKSACQKLAWYYLINGDYTNYKVYMTKITTLGYEFTDEDKQAANNAKNNTIPNISLLRARLLFDGGYYDRSYKELEGKSNKNYSELRDQLEFIYRLARISQKEKKYPQALDYFQKCINLGKNLPYYFAMASCIEMGMLYEEQGNLINAKKYYTNALNFNNNKEYVNSLEQRAKAGISRLTN